MNSRKLALTPAVVCLSATLALLLAPPLAWAQSLQLAPLNPEFVQYVATVNGGQPPPTPATGINYGLLPLSFDVSYLTAQQQALARPPLNGYSASYDLRTLGRVTPVRNQNPYGTCWAFGALGSLESCLLPAETWDFSENNLANLAGYDAAFGDGGNVTMAMSYLVRWSGPVKESDDPYPNVGGSPTGLPVRKHVQHVRFLAPKSAATANDEIKQVLIDNGAINVDYYHDDAYYRSAYRTYYYPGSYTHNHSVTLVGWDDNFDRNKFSIVPPGNGAYIVKNSWGTSWGESGYFYVSYYDTTFGYGTVHAFLNAESTNNYLREYSYDPLGRLDDVGVGSTTLWGANLFTATASEYLCAVSFYANSYNTAYAIEIHTGIAAGAPSSGTLASTKTGTCTYPGYYTIKLDTPARLTAGQQFSIVLKLTTPGRNYPQPVEYAIAGFSSRATASPGQSYYSGDGSSWTDITTWRSTANFCIKGFTGVPVVRLSIVRTPGSVTLTWPAGVLQQANAIGGPYTDVSGATSPYTTTCSGPCKFYRLR